VTPDGNPAGPPVTILLALSGLPATQRDGRLRSAISAVIGLASQRGYRALVSGLPTGRFRDRLVQMTANAGLSVIAVDPAYTR